MTVQQDPTYPPEPYHSLQNQSNTRNGQKSAAQGSPSVQYQPESARDGSFDQDTEALLHSTDQSPISSKQESTPRAKTTRDTPKRDFFDVPLTNAGYRTPSIFLVLLGLAALGSLGYLLSVAFVGFTRYGRNLSVFHICSVYNIRLTSIHTAQTRQRHSHGLRWLRPHLGDHGSRLRPIPLYLSTQL